MPFTFAHPAAVVWCARWHASVPFSAFVIGSMSPDFEYFIRLSMLSFYSHTIPGILTFCVPFGLVIFAAYETLIAQPLFRNLPRCVRERIPARAEGGGNPYRKLALISLALAVGAATHILWDGFTLGNGPFVLRWPWLGAEVLGSPIYKFLQHGSTLAGFAILAGWLVTRPARACVDESGRDRWYWPLAGGSFLIALAALQQIRPGVALTNLAIQGIDGLFLALLAAGCWARVRIVSTHN